VVHFSKFRTESGFDPLTLRDGAGRAVFVYSGDRGAFTSADALGEKLVLEFRSDAVGTDWGFEVDYDEASY
jgi:hypothetical protein